MQNDPLVGQHLGAYLIQSKLGEGGMARVYKAYHARLRRDVAIKVILSQIADQVGFQARFEREAQLIASLEHANIVAVYDFGEVGNLTYLVMQYVGGGTLRDQLRSGRPLEPLRATRYALQMARALHHAHLRGIVHRDVKPQNMLISSSDPNLLLLSDFGIAKLFNSSQEATWANTAPGGMSSMSSDSSITNIGQIVGTAEYMSPEQINGKPVDARTDVYALGVVLFQMLTGEVPFQSTTVQGLLYQHVYTPPRPVREVNPNVPDILAQITAKAMAKAPEYRFQSAEEMAQALEFANANVTNPLSTRLPDNLTTLGAYPDNPLAIPAPNRSTGSPASNYGQSVVPGVPVTPPPGQHTVYEAATPNSGHIDRITAPGIGSQVIHPPARSAGMFRLSRIAAGLILLLALALLVVRLVPGVIPSSQSPTSVATPFTETFQDNHLNWLVGINNNLTASLSNNMYALDIGNASQTYFPHPDAGTLPDNFTLTVMMEQTKGDTSAFYGLAFRLREDGSNVYCYALSINQNGTYQVLKYDPNASRGFDQLFSVNQAWSAIKQGVNQINTLQAIVHGSTFSFKINDTLVPVNNPPNQTLSDSAYTGGQLALLVAGANASFTVTSVQLAIP